MIQQPLVSDLVHDSKIETVLDGNVAQHTYYSSGQSARERIVRRKETWVRDGSTAFLGQGAYGTVFRERCDQRLRAVKAIKKCVVVGEELDYARELEAIIKFSHPKYSHCFVRSYGWFESADSVFITMEYLRHGDLQKRLTQPLPEGQARQIIAQVLEGLQHMHNNGFVHRELKPGNIMIVTPGPEWFVKITDFGISKRRQECATTLHTLQRGAFGFAAPEALGLGSDDSRASYTFAVDMWSLGAVTYKILTSVAPFQSLVDLFRYATGILDFPLSELYTHNITKTAQDLVLTLMSPQPNRRPSASAASGHLWFTSDIGDLPRHELEL
ncbi:kinase-like domain-containing protein [Pseudomassariella vexata]|uniref:Kinase-like domain-containing protein n=1 Tax=Pseudomassariella vexata TaxID=1141098 RepID=A0A1Y2DRA6_9PEZI|nr:kinase-like domain-containing protein [Pseudomassariella vexata]ORY61767.1 kinase-like domain-containing protein [Pseudomassariella vexata]